ncbi:hypothetical protein [Litchfieldia alkalitelluris]|uniref:hypothetical protein n=1 Tax=Litchfieldia alkalitelluris TaxID=304268 RepID=UPI000995EA4B|nr:hypothetical protein [Litchfieldia alkalitelluris]
MKYYKITGIVFLIMSGLIYTLERGFSLISTSIVKAGFYAGTMSGEVPTIEASGIFNNFFVLIFLIIGVAFVVYGFKSQ